MPVCIEVVAAVSIIMAGLVRSLHEEHEGVVGLSVALAPLVTHTSLCICQAVVRVASAQVTVTLLTKFVKCIKAIFYKLTLSQVWAATSVVWS